MKTYRFSTNAFCLWLLLLSIGFFECGCGPLIDAAFSSVRYDSRVDYYRATGSSKKDAKQNATNDAIFDMFDDD